MEAGVVGPEECALVQSIIDARWRLATCPVLEFAVIAKGTAALLVPLSSVLRDATGSWQGVFLICAAVNALAALLAIFALRPMRQRRQRMQLVASPAE